MIKITKYFIKNHTVTNVVVLLLFLTGLFSMILLQREEMPVINFEQMRVTTTYPGASPKDVEINVTSKIEKKVMEVGNLKKVTSVSMEGRSIVIAEIDTMSANIEKTKKQIKDAVHRVTDLPDSILDKPVVEEITSNYPLIELAIHGNVSEKKLRAYAKELESRLKEISGLGKIEKIGYRKREVKINVNVEKMKQEQISFKTIMHAIKSRNVRQTGGTIDSYISEKKVVTLSEFDNPLHVKDIIVRSNYEGYGIRLHEIAIIKDDFKDHDVFFRSNGKYAISFLISKQEGYDIINVSDTVKNELKKFKSVLPKNIQITEIYDYSILTRSMLDVVVNNAILGFILVLIIMFLFLDYRSALWSAFGIPFSIISAFILFKPFGLTINMVSLGAMMIIIGIIVDDAIVITERIYSLKQQGKTKMQAAIIGVQSMSTPVIASIITTIIAFLPVLFIPGVMGNFMTSIPIVVSITLLFSLIEALFLIPAHIYKADVKKIARKTSSVFINIKSKYFALILKALQNRKKVVLGFFVLLIIVFSLSFLVLEFKLEEDINPDYFAIKIETHDGTSLLKTSKMIKPIEQLVSKTVPKKVLKSFKTIVGNHSNVTDYLSNVDEGSNLAIITVYLHPASERAITSEEIMSQLKPKLLEIKNKAGFKKLHAEFLGFASGEPVEILIIGNNDSLRTKYKNKIITFLKTQKGVYNIRSNIKKGKDELQIKLNHDLCSQLGITAIDVAHSMRTAFNGNVITTIRKGDEDIDFRIKIKNARKYRENGILHLPVSNNTGRLILLKTFAHLEKKPGVSAIYRRSGKRATTILAKIDDEKTTSFAVNEAVKNIFADKINRIQGMRIIFGGQHEETNESMNGFYFALIIVVLAIFFLLVIIFKSYIQPILIMSIIPFAVMSVFLTLMIHNMPLVFISLVGLLGLIGVVVNDTIVMISHINLNCKEKGSSLIIIAESAVDRLRPVMLTTLTTFAGLLPTAYGIGGDLPVIRPLIIVMAWGLLFSTVVTLGLIPIIVSFTKIKKQE